MVNLRKEKERNDRMKKQLDERLLKSGAAGLHNELNQALPDKLKPGNVGDINKIIWPFWFTFTAPVLPINTGSNGFVTITQEAAFIWMSTSKTVFKRTGAAPNYVYTAIDGANPDDDLSSANNLTVSIRDAQSSRVFMGSPIEIDDIGPANEPSVLPTPQFIMPNATIECAFQNNHASNVYVPWITLFGYRIRIENAENLLSTIFG